VVYDDALYKFVVYFTLRTEGLVVEAKCYCPHVGADRQSQKNIPATVPGCSPPYADCARPLTKIFAHSH